MSMTVDRAMVMQAVLDGQLSTEHVTIDEIVITYHALADKAIADAMLVNAERQDVLVFDYEWDYLQPN